MVNGDYIMTIAPSDYPGKKYRNRYCYEHYLIFWQTYGIIPNENELIHHKDEDKHNNTPDNLELKTREKHTKDHILKRGKTMVELICPNCQKHFTKEKRQTYLVKKDVTYTCCSRKCSGSFSHLPSNEKQNKSKNMFVREFKKYPDL